MVCVTFSCHQDPIITGFQPAVGPVSGGSRLTVIGRHLDVGSHVTAVLTNGENATVHCRLDGHRSPDSVTCITGSSTRPTLMNYLVVSIDSARVNFAGRFDFVADPVVESVMPFKTIIRCLIAVSLQAHITQQLFTAMFTDSLEVSKESFGNCRRDIFHRQDALLIDVHKISR